MYFWRSQSSLNYSTQNVSSRKEHTWVYQKSAHMHTDLKIQSLLWNLLYCLPNLAEIWLLENSSYILLSLWKRFDLIFVPFSVLIAASFSVCYALLSVTTDALGMLALQLRSRELLLPWLIWYILDMGNYFFITLLIMSWRMIIFKQDFLSLHSTQ